MSTIELLDEEGAITDQFCDVLKSVFLRYATSLSSSSSSSSTTTTSSESTPSSSSAEVMNRTAFAKFSQDTNGQPLTDETWTEVTSFLDLEDDGLTFKGFLQLYQLQTENDEEETAKDLKAWGYDLKTLELVTSRKDAPDEGVKPPIEDLTGIGQGGEKKSEKDA